MFLIWSWHDAGQCAVPVRIINCNGLTFGSFFIFCLLSGTAWRLVGRSQCPTWLGGHCTPGTGAITAVLWIRIWIGSGPELDPDSMGSLDPYPVRNHASVECSLLRAEGFVSSLDISKYQFLIKKDEKEFLLYFFPSVFARKNRGFVSGSGYTWHAGSGSTALNYSAKKTVNSLYQAKNMWDSIEEVLWVYV